MSKRGWQQQRVWPKGLKRMNIPQPERLSSKDLRDQNQIRNQLDKENLMLGAALVPAGLLALYAGNKFVDRKKNQQDAIYHGIARRHPKIYDVADNVYTQLKERGINVQSNRFKRPTGVTKSMSETMNKGVRANYRLARRKINNVGRSVLQGVRNMGPALQGARDRVVTQMDYSRPTPAAFKQRVKSAHIQAIRAHPFPYYGKVSDPRSRKSDDMFMNMIYNAYRLRQLRDSPLNKQGLEKSMSETMNKGARAQYRLARRKINNVGRSVLQGVRNMEPALRRTFRDVFLDETPQRPNRLSSAVAERIPKGKVPHHWREDLKTMTSGNKSWVYPANESRYKRLMRFANDTWPDELSLKEGLKQDAKQAAATLGTTAVGTVLAAYLVERQRRQREQQQQQQQQRGLGKSMNKRGTIQKDNRVKRWIKGTELTAEQLAKMPPKQRREVYAEIQARQAAYEARLAAPNLGGGAKAVFAPNANEYGMTKPGYRSNVARTKLEGRSRRKGNIAGTKLFEIFRGTRNPLMERYNRAQMFGGQVTPPRPPRAPKPASIAPEPTPPSYDSDAAYRRFKRNLGLGIGAGALATGAAAYLMNKRMSKRMSVSAKSVRTSSPKRTIARSNKYM